MGEVVPVPVRRRRGRGARGARRPRGSDPGLTRGAILWLWQRCRNCHVAGRHVALDAAVRYPAYRLRRHVRWDLMAAVEFLERHVVAPPLQLRHDDTAALVDWQNLIGPAVRHVELRFSLRRAADDEAGREGDDATEEIAVDEAE